MSKTSAPVRRLARKGRTDRVSGILKDVVELPVNENGKLNDRLVFDTGESILIPHHFGTIDLYFDEEYTVSWVNGKLSIVEGIVE